MEETLEAGTVVHGYRLGRVIGRGGMGSVYHAVHLETGAAVAVKALHAHVASKAPLRKRFVREARASMAVGHPSIIRIIEVFEHEGRPMLAMELLEGESLETTLRREHKIGMPRLAQILVHVASALGTAHSLGIVHRDIKPENIFLTRDPQCPVKVLDFGIAKFTATEGANAETAALTRTGAMMGTPFYMSPEQAFGEKTIDHRADIWALGILMYRCLSGDVPTSGDNFAVVFRKVIAAGFPPLGGLAPEAPAEVCALVDRMLQKRADDRPWDLREVYEVLQRHAQQTAPSFDVAVAPVWDEDSRVSAEPLPSTAAPIESAPLGRTLALTPAALQLGVVPARAAGMTPTGTLAMDPEGAPRAVGDSFAPAVKRPTSRTWVFALVAIAALVVLGIALALRFRGV